jgi:hypothetical protein
MRRFSRYCSMGAGPQNGGQEDATLVLQDLVPAVLGFGLGDEYGDLPSAAARVLLAEGLRPAGVGVDGDRDDLVAEGEGRGERMLSKLADLADRTMAGLVVRTGGVGILPSSSSAPTAVQ